MKLARAAQAFVLSSIFPLIAGCESREQQAIIPKSAPLSPPAALMKRAFDQAGENIQFMFLADSNHHAKSINDFIQNPDVQKVWIDQGYVDFCLEFPVAMQAIFDLYLQGDLLDEDLRSTLFASSFFSRNERGILRDGMLFPFLQNCKSAGIRIHCVDSEYTPFTDAYREFILEMHERFLRMWIDHVQEKPIILREIDLETFRAKFNSFYSDVFLQSFTQHELDQWWGAQRYLEENLTEQEKRSLIPRTRMYEGEYRVAETVIERVGDRKSVVFYGLGHCIRRSGDLDSILGAHGGVFTVGLYADLPGHERATEMTNSLERSGVFLPEERENLDMEVLLDRMLVYTPK